MELTKLSVNVSKSLNERWTEGCQAREADEDGDAAHGAREVSREE